MLLELAKRHPAALSIRVARRERSCRLAGNAVANASRHSGRLAAVARQGRWSPHRSSLLI